MCVCVCDLSAIWMYPFTPRPPEAVVGVDDICDWRSNRKLNQEARPLILNIEVETTQRAEGYNLYVFHCIVYIYIYFLWRLQRLMAFHFSSPWLSRHSFFSWHYTSHPSDGLSAVWLIWLRWAIRTNSPFGVSRNKLTATASLFIIRISRFCGKNDRSEHVTQKKTKAYRVSWYLLGLRVSF